MNMNIGPNGLPTPRWSGLADRSSSNLALSFFSRYSPCWACLSTCLYSKEYTDYLFLSKDNFLRNSSRGPRGLFRMKFVSWIGITFSTYTLCSRFSLNFFIFSNTIEHCPSFFKIPKVPLVETAPISLYPWDNLSLLLRQYVKKVLLTTPWSNLCEICLLTNVCLNQCR